MPTNEQASLSLIDEILGDFVIYIDPQLLKVDLSSALGVGSANMDGIKKYRDTISHISFAWKQTLKYSRYFEKFYPSVEESGIENFEALNHHIYAYLQDMTILKNKIEVFLGELKNDIKKNADNKKEHEDFFKAKIDKTKEVFKGITDQRDPHHHKGMRFLDGDLLKAENAYGTLKMFSSPFFEGRLNPERKEQFFAELAKEKEETFESGKKRWIAMAQKNDEQTLGFINELFNEVRPTLYQYLKMRSVKSVVDAAEKKI